jgi:hypothetical protein
MRGRQSKEEVLDEVVAQLWRGADERRQVCKEQRRGAVRKQAVQKCG